MNEHVIANWVRLHSITLIVSYWLLSAAIGALPMPSANSNRYYTWFFHFANTFAANIARVAAAWRKQGEPGEPAAASK